MPSASDHEESQLSTSKKIVSIASLIAQTIFHVHAMMCNQT